MFSKFSDQNKKKFPICFYICLNCQKLIILNSIKLSYNNKIILNYECDCKKANIVLFDNYYLNLQMLYNTHKSKCKCGKKTGISYCYECKVYTCISCYLLHNNHFLLGKKIAYDLLCSCKQKSQGKCNTCNVYYCSSCLDEKHKNHHIVSFSELYNKIEKEEFDFYNKIDDSISKMTENIDSLKKKDIVNSLKELYSNLNTSFIKSRKYPHYYIMESLINMKITKLEYEKMRYKPRPIKPFLLILSDFKGKPPKKDIIRPKLHISCFQLLKNKKICLLIDTAEHQILQIYSENFKSLEVEINLNDKDENNYYDNKIFCFLPYQENSILLFGNGEIFKFTYKPFKNLLKKMTKNRPQIKDRFVRALYYKENSYIIKGQNIYMWNSITQKIVTLIKPPLSSDYAAFEMISNQLIFSDYDNLSTMFFDVEKKKIIKKLTFFEQENTNVDRKRVISILKVKELLILSLEVVRDSNQHCYYLSFCSFEEGKLIKSDCWSNDYKKVFIYFKALTDPFALGLTADRIIVLIDINIYQIILIDQSICFPRLYSVNTYTPFKYIEEYGNGAYIVTFPQEFICLIDFGKVYM